MKRDMLHLATRTTDSHQSATSELMMAEYWSPGRQRVAIRRVGSGAASGIGGPQRDGCISRRCRTRCFLMPKRSIRLTEIVDAPASPTLGQDVIFAWLVCSVAGLEL